MTTPVLTVTGARKRFGATVALDGADLSLQRGECVGLLGPNGAGKTTLVRSISGFVGLDAGAVTLLGTRLEGDDTAAAEARAALGVVPQEIAVYPLLTARENLTIFAALHGVPAGQRSERVRWALQWTGLEDRADDPARRFSGGMKRRLNIACGILHRPEVVLLDEPTVGVDPQSRQRIWEMLQELRRDGTTLLLTTHQLDEAQRICQRIVIIDHGRVIESGTVDELIARTIGSTRRVVVHLSGDTAALADQSDLVVVDGSVQTEVTELSTELPALIRRIGDAGTTIDDLRIESPSLQAVFIHLTGRELRE